MRKLSKPWPPSNVSPDGQKARSFPAAEREYLNKLDDVTEDKISFARSEFDRMDKSKLRAVMYNEQRSICVYCERRIKEAHPIPRIEHWHPLSKNCELAICWKNLYLSCPTRKTCDSRKGDRPLEWDEQKKPLPWPVEFAYEDKLSFTRLGEVYVRNDVLVDEATRQALKLAIGEQPLNIQSGENQSVLNLNHPALVRARKAALDAERNRMKKNFPNQHVTIEKRREQATEILRKKTLPPFVSIRVAWLRKTLGKGTP